MSFSNPKQICEQTRLYYYDYLFQKDQSEIPEWILSHIKRCENCKTQINQLKTAITQSEQNQQFSQNKSGTHLANTLKKHFSYIEQDTTCSLVKPFLPEMLNPSLQISIPTPITAHFDYCPECVKDLKTISDLNLNNTNLSRLSQFFAAKTQNNNISCSNAKSHIMAFVMMAFQETDKQILEHLCICEKCSDAIYQYRDSIIKELQIENKSKPCFLSNQLTYNNIFDFVIPYELDIKQYKQSETVLSQVSHIRRCPFCLQKIQEFHHIISDISERPNSETITKYKIDESKITANAEDSQELYAGFPVHVEVTGAYQETAASNSRTAINFTSVLKKNIITRNFRTLTKTGVAGLFVAAVVLSAMFIYSPKVKALSLSQLYNSLENANNVHVSSFVPDIEKPVQEQWVSRSFKMNISKIHDIITLVDINSKSKTIKDLTTGSINTQMISQELASDTEYSINRSLGLIPFYSISNIPPDAEWNKVTDSQNLEENTEIYELSYISDTFGDAVFIKMRYILKADTDLPIKVESYRKLPNESEYTLNGFKTIDYLSNEDFVSFKNNYFKDEK